MRQELSLDRPWLVQLGAWFADLARFDLGVSLAPGERAIDKLGIELEVIMNLRPVERLA